MSLNEKCEEIEFSCVGSCFITLLAILAIFASFLSIIRLFSQFKTIILEMVTLSLQTLQSIIIVLSVVWMQEVHILFSRMYLEVVIYSIIAFSFMQIHFVVHKSKFMIRIIFIVFLFFFTFETIMYFLVITGSIPISCANFVSNLSQMCLFFSKIGLCFVTIIFGITLIHDSKLNQNSLKKGSTQQEINLIGIDPHEMQRTFSELSSPSSLVNNQEFFKFQRKQLRLVIFSYFIINLVDIIWKIIFIENVRKDYVCYDQTQIYSVTLTGNLMDFFKNLFDIGLCFILPYVFCLAPLIKKGYFNDIEDFNFNKSFESFHSEEENKIFPSS